MRERERGVSEEEDGEEDGRRDGRRRRRKKTKNKNPTRQCGEIDLTDSNFCQKCSLVTRPAADPDMIATDSTRGPVLRPSWHRTARQHRWRPQRITASLVSETVL